MKFQIMSSAVQKLFGILAPGMSSWKQPRLALAQLKLIRYRPESGDAPQTYHQICHKISFK